MRADECKVGDHINIINAGVGALGVNGSTAVIVNPSTVAYNGIVRDIPTVTVKVDETDDVWLISADAEVTYVEDQTIRENPIKPIYYNDTKITPFDVIDDWSLNFYMGNAIKYIKRAGKKDGNSRLQDLKKVREYIDHEIKAEEENK